MKTGEGGQTPVFSAPTPALAAGEDRTASGNLGSGDGSGTRLSAVALAVIAGLGLILFLRVADAVFIPLVGGVLITYALDPIVTWLQQRSVPRFLGAGVLLLALVGGVTFGVYTLRDEAVAVVEKVPEAARKLRNTMKLTRGEQGGLMEKMQEAATEVEHAAAAATGSAGAPKGVTRVQVEEKPFQVGDYLWSGGASLVSVASEVILVIFLVYFMLVTGDLFRQKLMKIAGPSVAKRKITRQILDDIDRKISRYMLVQVMTSILVGVVSGLAFWWAGLEQPAVWGLAAGLLNTIPYFGPAIVAGGIFTIGFLQFGTLLMGAYVAGLSFVVTTLEGYLLNPWLTGRAIRMNGVAIFLGLMFWGWMWGAWGLLLAMPMLVVTKSICDQIEDLKPIGELLGD